VFNNDLICPTCQMGRLDLRLTTYVRMYAETLISVPNTPAWICDVCHAQQFDPMAVQRIEMLMGQAGPPPNRYRPAGVSPKVKHRSADKSAAKPKSKAGS
jgi:YgiT-type zinc finger domain-containing protein